MKSLSDSVTSMHIVCHVLKENYGSGIDDDNYGGSVPLEKIKHWIENTDKIHKVSQILTNLSEHTIQKFKNKNIEKQNWQDKQRVFIKLPPAVAVTV